MSNLCKKIKQQIGETVSFTFYLLYAIVSLYFAFRCITNPFGIPVPFRAGILNVLSCFINIRRIFRSIVFMQANIFKIKRNELADGSGLRTTIYFKGCPLRCVWCSTPQAHERPTRILWDSKHCLYCNLCVSECPTGSLAFSDNRLTFTPDTCTFCRACTDHCPSRMLHFVGQMMDMDEIMEKILADRELYGNGGVILSGGDPLMQPEAATAVLKKCKEHGIRTAIETTAFAKPLAFSRFIANADMIIIDLKHYSEKKYVQFTGVSNHSILENLDFAISIGKKVAVRITITPGINDTLIDARRYAHLLSEHHIRHVILLSYSNLGIIKYEKYTQSPALAREQTFSGQDMENYANMLRGLGFDVQIEQ